MITLVEVIQLLLDLCGVLSNTGKNLWRVYVSRNVNQDTSLNKSSQTSGNGVIDFNKIEKNKKIKINSEKNSLDHTRTIDKPFSIEKETLNEYFLNKLTTV